MRLNETKIFVFVAAMILGVLVAMNVSFKPLKPTKLLNAKQYQDAINERSKLFKEIALLEKQYIDINKKLREFEGNNLPNSKIIENMKEELEFNQRLLGTEEVVAKGINITLKDATTSFEGTIEVDEFFQWARIVHNTDVMEVVNSLKIAGAEAIAVNGQRIMSNSEFYCWGPFLKINGVNISAPFYISAIGNNDSIKKHLLSEDGYLTFLRYRGIIVGFSAEENVKIPGYIGDYKFKFAEEVKNN